MLKLLYLYLLFHYRCQKQAPTAINFLMSNLKFKLKVHFCVLNIVKPFMAYTQTELPVQYSIASQTGLKGNCLRKVTIVISNLCNVKYIQI